MGAWKQFTTKDVTITPFLADKGFSFSGDNITGSSVGINIFSGRNVDYTSSLNVQTGFVYSSSINSIYNSAKQLYYSNYLSSSRGDEANTGSLIPGVTTEDDVLQGNIQAPLYDNYLQSTLLQQRYWPTASQSFISTISIPAKLYGEKIVPNTFELIYTGSSYFPNGVLLTDDGDGNIISGSDVVGQIFYSHGITVLTTHSCELIAEEINTTPSLLDNTNISFSSSLTIYEQQYKCTILENEFGLSMNPTLLTASDSVDNTQYYDFATASFFEPYVTSVGLYNQAKQLLAVGKLSFPLPVSQFTDTTIYVNFDV
jgi:hypothetical protein